MIALLRLSPFKLECPHCRASVRANAPWICGFCRNEGQVGEKHVNRRVIYFSFLKKCSNPTCEKPPPAYRCPNCCKAINLGKDTVRNKRDIAEYYRAYDVRLETEAEKLERRQEDLGRVKVRYDVRKDEHAFDIDKEEIREDFHARRVDLKGKEIDQELGNQEKRFNRPEIAKHKSVSRKEFHKGNAEKNASESDAIVQAFDEHVEVVKADPKISEDEKVRRIKRFEIWRDRELAKLV